MASSIAEAHGVRLLISEVIYDLAKAIEGEFRRLDKNIVKGDLEILALFGKKSATEQVVGGKVSMGSIANNGVADVERRNAVLGTAKIMNLQQNKKDATAVAAGNECGLLIDSAVAVRVGDHLILR